MARNALQTGRDVTERASKLPGVERSIAIVALAVVLAAISFSCGHQPAVYHPRITGTCEGACRHYLVCKDRVTETRLKVCVDECRIMFAGRDGLAAFEHLSCEKAVSFIEGKSGRGPGATP